MNLFVLCTIVAVAAGAVFATAILRMNGRKSPWHRIVFILSPVVIVVVFGYILTGGQVNL